MGLDFFIFLTRCHHYHLLNRLWSPLKWPFFPLISILHSFTLVFIFCFFLVISFYNILFFFLFNALYFICLLYFLFYIYLFLYILLILFYFYIIFSLFFSSCAKIFSFILNHVLSFVRGIEWIIMNNYMQV